MTHIALSMIVRDEAANLRRCLESVAPFVDEVVIVLAGESRDDTEAIAREFTDNVLSIAWPDDFAKARNAALELVSDKATHALWLDGDDVLEGGDTLRSEVARMEAAGENCLYVGYDYGKGEFGETVCFLMRERIVAAPKQWLWLGRVHETLNLDPVVPLVSRVSRSLAVVHQKTGKQKGTRNLDLLYKMLADSEPDPDQRTLMYIGNEQASRGDFNEALRQWGRFLARAQWTEEAYQVAHKIADVLRRQQRYDEARRADLRAIEIEPTWPDAFYGLAQTAYEQGRFMECIEWTKAGQTKPTPLTGMIVNPRDYDFWPSYWLGKAYAELNQWDAALDNLRLAAGLVPEPQVLAEVDALERERDAQKVLAAFKTMREHLGRHDEWLKVRTLHEAVPHELQQHPDVTAAWARTAEQTAHVEDPEVMVEYYKGIPGWKPMDEKILWSDGWLNHPRVQFALTSLCPAPSYILDIGCSDGFIDLRLAEAGHVVFGLDLDPRCIAVANERAQERGWGATGNGKQARAYFMEGSVDDAPGTYDVAMAFEVIEHLVDPAAFLDELDKKARKVLLTTPYLAWEHGRLPAWDKVEPKGHLRIFDNDDVERLLAGRGRIVDLYTEPWKGSGWVFASYKPGTRYRGSVTFIAPGTPEAWSPRTLKTSGLGGSELALIKLAAEMADTDLRVTTYTKTDAPGYYKGVAYRPLERFMGAVRQDVVVAWRYPEIADEALNCGKLVLWMHDTDAGDRLTPIRAKAFDTIVVLSEWHKAHMLEVYPFLAADPDKLVVIGNGVDRERFDPAIAGKVKREPHRVAYTSSPDRGLDTILEHIWPKVTEAVPDAELHVYYGWDSYDAVAASRPEMREFRDKVARLTIENKGVVNHGRVTQDVLATELRKASVWLYPTTFHETYCISAVEAQLAGAVPVTNDRAALAETVKSGVVVDQSLQDPNSSAWSNWPDAVITLLTGKELSAKMRREAIARAPVVSWHDVASQWLDAVGLTAEDPDA